MTEKEGKGAEELKAWQPQLVVISSPNAATAGPTAAREAYRGIPTIIISDGPSKKEAREALSAEGYGYIILPMDPLIGAKREFLDPAEMGTLQLRCPARPGRLRSHPSGGGGTGQEHSQHHLRTGQAAHNSCHPGEVRRENALL